MTLPFPQENEGENLGNLNDEYKCFDATKMRRLAKLSEHCILGQETWLETR